jgi:copper transport protein
VKAFVKKLLFLLAAVAGLVLVPAVPAFAHATLTGADPKPDSVLTSAPRQVTLTYDEAVDIKLGQLRVVAPDGSTASVGKPGKPHPNQVRVRLAGTLRDGTYLVSWRVISADSHPVAGGYTFSIGSPSKAPTGPAAGGGPTSDRTVAILLAGARWLGFAGLILLVGPAVLYVGLWPRRIPAGGIRRLIMIGAVAVGLGAVGALVLQGPYAAGTGLGGITGAQVSDVLSSRFGQANLVRFWLAVLAVPVLLALLRRRGAVGPRATAAVVAAALLLTWPLAGHPDTSKVPLLTVPADMLHLAAVTTWVGGLVGLSVFLLPKADADELRLLLPEWSRWATYAVSTIVLTGAVQALTEFDALDEVWQTTYGRLLLVKLALVATILGVASTARAWVRRTYVLPVAYALEEDEEDGEAGEEDYGEEWPEPGSDEVRRLRRSVFVEVAIAAVVLGVTAALVQTAPAKNAAAGSSGSSQAGPFTTTVRQATVTLAIDVEPARTGDNSMHLYAYDAAGRPMAVQEFDVTVSLPAKKVAPIDVPVANVTPDHALASEVSLPVPGRWTVRITVRTSAVDETVFTVVVPIR